MMHPTRSNSIVFRLIISLRPRRPGYFLDWFVFALYIVAAGKRKENLIASPPPLLQSCCTSRVRYCGETRNISTTKTKKLAPTWWRWGCFLSKEIPTTLSTQGNVLDSAVATESTATERDARNNCFAVKCIIFCEVFRIWGNFPWRRWRWCWWAVLFHPWSFR
jgi:hypothetical protein